MKINKEFYKELCSLAVPVGLQNLLLALIGASDALMLGRLTQDAISAVSLANQVAFIMNLFMVLLCLLGPVVAGFFILSDTAKQYLIIMLVFSAFYVFAYSVNTIIVCGIFPAGGDAKYDAERYFSRHGAFRFRWL